MPLSSDGPRHFNFFYHVYQKTNAYPVIWCAQQCSSRGHEEVFLLFRMILNPRWPCLTTACDYCLVTRLVKKKIFFFNSIFGVIWNSRWIWSMAENDSKHFKTTRIFSAKEFRKLYGMTGVWQTHDYYLQYRQRKITSHLYLTNLSNLRPRRLSSKPRNVSSIEWQILVIYDQVDCHQNH